MSTATTRIEIRPIEGAPLGAEIVGDLSTDPSGEEIHRIIEAFRRHHLLVVKEQPLPDERLLEIASWFGPQFVPDPDIPVLGTDEQGAVTILSNRKAANAVESTKELPFHSDFQFLPVPLLGALLHAVEVPPVEAGGNTSWSNLHMALDELDPEIRARIEHVKGIGINPWVRGQGGETYSGDTQRWSEKPVPDFPHPLIRTHPDTGRQSLYFSMFMWKLDGIDDPAEEAEILDALRAHVDQDRFYYTHEWSAGDTMIWDNRCTNHKRAPFDQSHAREMHRIQIAGTRPY